MHALANINMIRLWGGAGLWPAALLCACDEAGIMVWLEFWITGALPHAAAWLAS